MREIKFRARINEGGRNACLNEWQYFTLDELASCPDLWDFIDPNTKCQFTGLRDRNGKEIYEGDIVSYSVNGITVKSYVEWLDGGFWMQYDYIDRHENMEVTGNIYENPELLEVK